jgi:hypothetical protein
MRDQKDALEVVGVKVKSVKKLNKKSDVYCMKAEKNGTLIANGIICSNCDALRYALHSHKVSFHNHDKESFRNLGRSF